MSSDTDGSDVFVRGAGVPVDLRQRSDARLVVSRIAARMFWEHGVSATRGEDIAAAAGISTRTLWRYFRSKEACVEPLLVEAGRRFVDLLTAWPLELSLEDFLSAATVAERGPYTGDEELAMRIVTLGMTEPALRSAWLMVCDAGEQDTTSFVARRLGLPSDDLEVLRITAAVAGAVRAVSDAMDVDYIRHGIVQPPVAMVGTIATAIREASGGRLGPAVTR